MSGPTICRVCGTDAEGAFAPSARAMISGKNGRPYTRKSSICRKCAAIQYRNWYQLNSEAVISRVLTNWKESRENGR